MTDKFMTFAQNCEEISLTRSTNEKVKILSKYLSMLTPTSLPIVVLLFSGRIFAPQSGLLLKVAYSTIMNVLSEISDLRAKEVNRIYLKHGDLGSLVEYSLAAKLTSPLVEYLPLTLAAVYHTLTKMAEISGDRSQYMRKKILAGLLLNCTPLEGKYLTKVLTNELRIGLSEGLLIAAISKAFEVSLNSVRNAMLVTGNIAQVSLLAKKNLLETAKMRPLSPISFMLADVMYSPSEIVDYFQKDLIAEYKYDGVRAQVHIHGNKVKIFSRNLNDVTSFFPELTQGALESIEGSKKKLILDGEILAFANGKVMSFQHLQRRLHAKNLRRDGNGMVGVLYTIFDALFVDKEIINLPLFRRKTILNNLKVASPFTLAKWKLVNSKEMISDMFNKSRNMGYEGLVLKDPQSEYQIGKRGRKWIKFKKELDTLDVIIVISEYGHGKRAGMLSDYTFAVKKSEHEDQLLTMGKAYSGLTDKEITELTSELKSMAIRSNGYRIWVEPKIVLEVSFDSIQRSDRHESGYALRFPRIKAIRRDKSLRDIDNLSKVREIYLRQPHNI
ncbi:MAG TPA: ATP-dependent DNA ligase [Nitrososphaeraceae archaeon]|jgi:DNA ligase-1